MSQIMLPATAPRRLLVSVLAPAVIGAALIATAVPRCARAAEPPDDRARLKVIAHAYQANRDAFTQFTCRYRVNYAKAARLEDIPSDKLTDRFTVQGIWVVDGPRVRLELTCDPSAIKVEGTTGANGGLSMVSFLPSTYLGDGQFRLSASPTVGVANIHPPESYAGVQGTPFDMGWMGNDEKFNPARLILQALETPDSCRYLGEQRLDGKKVVTVEVEQKQYKRKYTFQMDPDKAFWPVHTVVTDDGKPSYVYRIPRLEAATSGQWYPAVAYWISYPFGQTHFSAREFVVDELRLEPPGPRQFCVVLPQGTTINEPTTDRAQFTLEKDTEYCLKGLQPLVAQTRIVAEDRLKQQSPPSNHSPASSGQRNLMVALGVLLLATLGVAYAIRRRQGRLPAPDISTDPSQPAAE